MNRKLSFSIFWMAMSVTILTMAFIILSSFILIFKLAENYLSMGDLVIIYFMIVLLGYYSLKDVGLSWWKKGQLLYKEYRAGV